MEMVFFYIFIAWVILLGNTFISISFHRGLPFLTSSPRDDGIRDTTITFMKNINSTTTAPSHERTSPFSIDVLIIGSNSNMEHIQAQRETWASHNAVRHFFVSTEDDEVHPICQNLDDKKFASYWMDLQLHIATCRSGEFWRDTTGEMSRLTTLYSRSYFGMEKLKKKYSNPLGWTCAQRRFITALTELFEIYADPRNNYTVPDYFIFADDDSYVNIDHIVKQLMIDPLKQKTGGVPDNLMQIPTLEDPVVSTGCRFEIGKEDPLTSPWGGYGMFFSKGSLEKMIRPLSCHSRSTYDENGSNSDGSSWSDNGSCEKLLHKQNYDFPMNQTIGEEKYFEIGDSLNQVFYKYSREVKHFCLHSDWLVGYWANFHNISDHTNPGFKYTLDDKKKDAAENRLHALPRTNRYLKAGAKGQGCIFGLRKKCLPTASACHRMKKDTLHKIHGEAKHFFNYDF